MSVLQGYALYFLAAPHGTPIRGHFFAIIEDARAFLWDLEDEGSYEPTSLGIFQVTLTLGDLIEKGTPGGH
jgi:hypothetical protein